MATSDANFLESTTKLFRYYKSLGDKTMAQVSDLQLFEAPENDGNSIATLVRHMSGNMLSRFTGFPAEDGEKPWRHRDKEFSDTYRSRKDMIDDWEKGWACLFEVLEDKISAENVMDITYIRNEGHTIMEAMQRQLGHYAYHTGQLVLLGKNFAGAQWQSLSIAKGHSQKYMEDKMKADKSRKHFTDE